MYITSSNLYHITYATILWAFKVVTSWWILAHEGEYIMEYVLWVANYLDITPKRLIDIVRGNIFRKSFKYLILKFQVLNTYFEYLILNLEPSQFSNLKQWPKTNYDEIAVLYSIKNSTETRYPLLRKARKNFYGCGNL